MLQMLLSEWIVRFFLLYLFVVGGVALIRHQRQAVSRRFVFSPVTDIRDRWAAARAMWWDKYPTRDKQGIRISHKEQKSSEFRRRGDDVRYV